MRVTQRMLTNSLQYALQRNLNGISKTQEEISLGTRINRPSDDPAGFSQTLALQSNLNLNKQYQRNITDGLGWLEQTDVGLDKATVAMQTAREKAVQGANDTLTQDDRIALAEQIDAMTDEMVEVANTSLGGKYIFAGLKNTYAPFSRSGDDFMFVGDDNDVLREIAPGGRYEVNINGKKFFYDKLVEVDRGAGSMVDTVDITADQDMVKSFGALPTDLFLATPGNALNGNLKLNIDGKSYNVTFSNVTSRADILATINSVLGVAGTASMDADSNLIISSSSTNLGTSIKVTSCDQSLSGLKLLAGFNNLQFGKYTVATVDGTGPSASTAVVSDYYAQGKNTIVSNVGVVNTSNSFNSSVLMEVTKVNYTQNHAEILSSAALGGVLPTQGNKLGLNIDGKDYTVTFSTPTNPINPPTPSWDDYVKQINDVIGTAGEASISSDNFLVIRSSSTGQGSTVRVTQVNEPTLNLQLNQDCAVGITDVTVKFTYHIYDKDGIQYDGCMEQKFWDTDKWKGDVLDDSGPLPLVNGSTFTLQGFKSDGTQGAAQIYTITTGVNDNLTALASAINADSATTGVTATLTGAGTTNARLVLSTVGGGELYADDDASNPLAVIMGGAQYVSSKDGDPDSPAHIILQDDSGTHNIDLNIDLTRFISTGDKAVISVAAQAVAGDDSISVNYDGKDRKWVFNDGAVDSAANIKFFSLDEGNGESYDGGINLTFNGSISDSSEAATFTAGNIFDSLVYLRKKLENNQSDKINKCLDYLDEKIGWLLQERVRVGARTNHLESVDEQYTNLEVNLSDMMKGYYSTDVAKATVELGEKQLTYQASLAAGARIMQTSLLDYLS
ncbi:MAG: Flagellar hook-associated protein 3 [Pelotomaculum sp. PtaB.Bin104]|nr:MAG: Flagellar hook-associated protein 3 [Pelotomaculum sp. PtaB.Bin104]